MTVWQISDISWWRLLVPRQSYRVLQCRVGSPLDIQMCSPWISFENILFGVSACEWWFGFVTFSYSLIVFKGKREKVPMVIPFRICYTEIVCCGIFKWGEKETSQSVGCCMVNCKVIGLLSRCGNPFDLSTTKFQFWLAIVIKATWETRLSAY